MSVLNRLASAIQRGDEAPNEALAREIAQAENSAAIKELVANLSNADKAIQSDCIKVLYEIGAINRNLIAPYADDFLKLLRSRNNRLVWGAMTALGAIVDQKAEDLWKHIDLITETTRKGSVITQDWGIRVLAALSTKEKSYELRIFPFLTAFLQDCPPKDLPRHAESALVSVNTANREHMLAILEARKPALSAAQAKRLDQVIRKINAI